MTTLDQRKLVWLLYRGWEEAAFECPTSLSDDPFDMDEFNARIALVRNLVLAMFGEELEDAPAGMPDLTR